MPLNSPATRLRNLFGGAEGIGEQFLFPPCQTLRRHTVALRRPGSASLGRLDDTTDNEWLTASLLDRCQRYLLTPSGQTECEEQRDPLPELLDLLRVVRLCKPPAAAVTNFKYPA